MTQEETEEGAAPLTIRSFGDRTGTTLPLSGPGIAHEMTLTAVDPLPNSAREGGGFRLEFRAPAPALAQGSYGFTIDGAVHEIFIVPLGPDPERRMRYEAIFY